jgi:hypothetical protein
MNPIERGQSFVKELNELNVNAFTKYFDIQREALEQYVDANRNRFAALREAKDVSGFVDAQREYYAALQKNVTAAIEKQVELARTNFEATGKLVRGLFQSDSAAA